MSSSDTSNKRAREDENKGEEDWTKQPPYALEDPKKPKKAVFTGSCHCKDVTFDIYVEKPKGAHFCHCDTCQKLHGSAMHWSTVISKNDVLFTCSADKLSFYRTEDQRTVRELPAKISCARCHSPIADEGRNMMLMYPSTFDFTDSAHKEPFLPTQHLFYSNRSIEIEDGKTKWEGMPKKSDTMDEEHHHGKKGTAGSGSK